MEAWKDQDALPAHHHYLGPLFWELPGTLPTYVLSQGDPWVLVAMSTGAVRREVPYVEMALEALRDQAVRMLVTLGEPRLLAGSALPPNARVEAYVPHSEMLARSRLLIGHGGHGGVIKALYHGVPMVLLPRSADQFAVAARAAAMGAAEVLDREEVTKATLAQAVRQVLIDPEYARSAQSAAGRLRRDQHLDEGLALIEAL